MRTRLVVFLVLGTCILSAGIGAGITMLVKEGPEGPPGPQGEQGPRGVQGYSADEYQAEQAMQEVQDLESRLGAVESEVEDLGFERGFLEGEIEEVSGGLQNTERAVREMCFTLEFTGCP